MTTVFLYLGSARFSGKAAFEWPSPKQDGVHPFILFLAQSDGTPRNDLALREVGLFGFSEIELEDSRPISVESLNDPEMAAFRKHYEGAFIEGSSLVWYP